MKKNSPKTRLIVAASENDPDMLYATRFFAPDAFIFLEQDGKRTLVLSDLEIDRARRQAEADEILPYSVFE
ncbi:MAG: aminopeptidase P family protein, partial [Chthoniobacterales bacterium]|nr:aminopeptidase P family protein [Chthoniobacterales bacterium]